MAFEIWQPTVLEPANLIIVSLGLRFASISFSEREMILNNLFSANALYSLFVVRNWTLTKTGKTSQEINLKCPEMSSFHSIDVRWCSPLPIEWSKFNRLRQCSVGNRHWIQNTAQYKRSSQFDNAFRRAKNGVIAWTSIYGILWRFFSNWGNYFLIYIEAKWIESVLGSFPM